MRRYRARAESGERHPGHYDLAVADAVAAALTTGEYEPLDLGVPTLRIDTTTGERYAPSFDDVLAFVASVAGGG